MTSRALWLAGSLALVGVGLVPLAQAAEVPVEDRSPAICGAHDSPETGIQGDVPRDDQEVVDPSTGKTRAEAGYNCGVAVVGHHDLDGLGGGDLARSGNCAYVKTPTGVVIVDVSEPTAPDLAGLLSGTGGNSENLHAVTTADRALLISSRSGAGSGPTGTATHVDVWDVRNCTDPVGLGAIVFSQAHNIELTPDAKHVWASMPLQVADITNLDDPDTWVVTDHQCAVASQAKPGYTGALLPFAPDRPTCWNQLAHEFEFDPSIRRMYIGGQLPGEEELRIVDITGDAPRVISTVAGGGHSIKRVTAEGRKFLLNNDESVAPSPTPALAIANLVLGQVGGPTVPRQRTPVDNTTGSSCMPDDGTPMVGAAQAWLTEITDETAPRAIAELGLAINEPRNCAAQVDSQVKSTAHYTGVDNPDNTRFVMVPMGNAGLRIFDVHDPDAPTEIAYWNPGQFVTTGGERALDAGGGHVHYDAATGHIWRTTSLGGFWVLELEPDVRAALDLPAMPTSQPSGGPARPFGTATVVKLAARVPDPADPFTFCKLA